MDEVFTVRENRFPDGSAIFEIWQRGSDQRLGAADDPSEAHRLAYNLNRIIDGWTLNTHNTVDC